MYHAQWMNHDEVGNMIGSMKNHILKVFFNYPQKCYEELYSKEYEEELRCTLNKISVREKVM